jgi:acyl carrier protein
LPSISPSLHRIVVAAIGTVATLPPHTDPRELDGLDLRELGIDSLDLSTILVEIEEAAGEEIPAEVLDDIIDVADIVVIADVVALLADWRPPAVVAAET